jgi:hypothetical protein
MIKNKIIVLASLIGFLVSFLIALLDYSDILLMQSTKTKRSAVEMIDTVHKDTCLIRDGIVIRINYKNNY